MKAWKICILIGCLGSILSCMMYTGLGPSSYVGHPYANSSAQDEIIITDELKELISSNPKLKIVIRIAQPSQSVTTAERVISDVNIFEKTLVRNGYVVRDRALLENLMKSESSDYLSIKDKIDTDIIIEILRIEFGIPNQESFPAFLPHISALSFSLYRGAIARKLFGLTLDFNHKIRSA